MACGAEPVVYVERGAFAAAVLVARMAEASLGEAPLWDDVTTFDARAWRGVVDIVAGGSPCQDLSVAGKRAGLDGLRSGLWRHQLRVLDETGASFLFWENVGGAIKSALDVVTHDVGELGYRTAACTLRASDVGAPHKRERLFVLAYSEREALRLESESVPGGRTPSVPGGRTPSVPSIPVGKLADSDGDRPEGLRFGRVPGDRHPQRGHVVDGCGGEDVADTSLPGLERGAGRGARPRNAGGAAERSGEAVADAHESSGRPTWDAERGNGAGTLRLGAQEHRRRGGALGNAEEQRREKGRPECPGQQRLASSRLDGGEALRLHRFPPGREPRLWDGWDGPQPSFRRVPHGTPEGMEFATDRLELLGNGVVPQQAAAAFLICWQRLFGGG
jgi:site-specific DNA-cytosine methylase